MEYEKYDESYYVGKTKVTIVSPETVLGRKMSEEEKQVILEEIKKVNIEILKLRIVKGELAI